jgi:hypothetical protein
MVVCDWKHGFLASKPHFSERGQHISPVSPAQELSVTEPPNGYLFSELRTRIANRALEQDRPHCPAPVLRKLLRTGYQELVRNRKSRVLGACSSRALCTGI